MTDKPNTTDDDSTDSQPDRSELETARAIVDEAIGRGTSRRALMLAAAAGVSGAALGTLGGRASAASPSDASGTVYFDQIGDNNNPVEELYIKNQIVSDSQKSISTDEISDDGSGDVSLLSPLTVDQVDAKAVNTDSIQVTNGLVAGEKIGSDSGSKSSLSVSVNPANYRQITIHAVSCFVDSTDLLLSTDGTGNYRGQFNDGTTFSRTDGIPLLVATNAITPNGTITITPDPTRAGFATSIDLFFPQSQARISNFAVSGGYTSSDYSTLELTGLDSTESQEMQVYGVQ